mmetsp:Transcript_137072/g.238345  ORF Transcript_137072/g.238345 Transcript_137072/m.238345 type:complete len:98 (+) Transcript_137072:2563-2856(+)
MCPFTTRKQSRRMCHANSALGKKPPTLCSYYIPIPGKSWQFAVILPNLLDTCHTTKFVWQGSPTLSAGGCTHRSVHFKPEANHPAPPETNSPLSKSQ